MRICAFCGSSIGNDPIYSEATEELGITLAARGIELVYGGTRVGLMGILANSVLGAGGKAIGVIPKSLVAAEIQHECLTACHIVATMHERKTIMAELADGFIALPGGIGTLEEIFEQWTWAKLGIHVKPCGFLNTNAFFNPLRKMLDQMVLHGFLESKYASMVVFDKNPAALIEALGTYSPPPSRWQRLEEPGPRKTIKIVAALIQDKEGRVLLVRKRGTRAFMQPGGKLRDSEADLTALERELTEELTCSMCPQSSRFLGKFTAPAANESDCTVEAAVYYVELLGSVKAAAEIEEIVWLNTGEPPEIELAPLTRNFVLPLASTRLLAKQTAEASR